MFCPKCGNQVEDGSRFCGFCGNRFETAQPEFYEENEPTMAYDQLDDEAFFVPQVPAQNPYPGQPGAAYPVKAKKNTKLPIKWIAIGAGALAALILIIVLVGFLGGGSGDPNVGLYIKDEEMMFTDLSGDPIQITDRMVGGFEDIDDDELADGANSISRLIHISEDGNRIFFPDRIGPDNDSNEGYTIYYRNPNKPKEEPKKLDSGITEYYASRDGRRVVYIKDDNLYVHDLKERVKIDSDVRTFYTDEDASVIYYKDEDDTLYVKNGNKDKEKIDRDVEYLEYMSEDGKTLLYTKEGSVYRYELGKEKEKIVSGDGYVLEVTTEGNFYYVESETLQTQDFVANDMEENFWMEDLKDATLDVRTLYYYEGSEEFLVAENVLSIMQTSNGYSNVLYIIQLDPDNAGKVMLSDIVAEYRRSDSSLTNVANSKIRRDAAEDGGAMLVINETTTEFEYENMDAIQLSEDGKTLYFLAEFDSEKNTGDLYKVSVSGGKLGEAELVDEDVYDGYWARFVYYGMLVYYKDVESGTGDLFIDGKEVDYDVRTGSLLYLEDGSGYYYLSDWNSDRREGTLRHYNGSKTETVADDVHDAELLPNGTILYLQDYSTKSYKGDLYSYNGKKNVKIDEDVVALLYYSFGYHYAYSM